MHEVQIQHSAFQSEQGNNGLRLNLYPELQSKQVLLLEKVRAVAIESNFFPNNIPCTHFHVPGNFEFQLLPERLLIRHCIKK